MKRLISSAFVLVLLMISVAATPLLASSATVDIAPVGGLTLADLKVKFPQGAYWNHIANSSHRYSGNTDVGSCNNPDGYTWTQCYSHAAGFTGSAGQADCNSFAGGVQCCGFANKLAYDVYGSTSRSWGAYNVWNCKPGDVIHYGVTSSDIYGHWVMVIARNGNDITLGECNWGKRCIISWTRVISIGSLYGSITCYSAPSTLPTSSEPVKTQVSVKTDGTDVTVSWNTVANRTEYDVYLIQAPNTWNDVKYSKRVSNQSSCTFSDVAPGEYSAFVIVRPNSDSVQSNWVSFTVNLPEKTHISVLKNGADIDVVWEPVSAATRYDIYLIREPGTWDDIRYKKSVSSDKDHCRFVCVEPGDYSAFVISRPNKDSEQSNRVSFSVKKSDVDKVSGGSLPDVYLGENILSGEYIITNLGANRVMNYAWGISPPYNPIILFDRDNSPEQTFDLQYKGGGLYTLAIRHPDGGAVNVYRNEAESAVAGDKITRCACNTDEQHHKFYLTAIGDGTYVIRPASNPSLVLGSNNTGQYPEIKLGEYDKNNGMLRWRLTPVNSRPVTTQPVETQPVTTQPVTTLPVTTEPTTPSTLPSRIIGDVDLDTRVTVKDATAIQKYLVSLITLSDEQLANADTDSDGKVKITDATAIQKYLARLTDHLG